MLTLALVATAVVCGAAAGGAYLAGCGMMNCRPVTAVIWGHPLAAITGLALLYVVVFGWHGPRDLPLDAGALVLTLAFLGGGLLFALRATRLPQPLFVIFLHGLGALFGCALLIVGLVHGPAGG